AEGPWYRVINAAGKRGWVLGSDLRVNRKMDFGVLPKELTNQYLMETFWTLDPEGRMENWTRPTEAIKPRRLPSEVEWVYKGDVDKNGEEGGLYGVRCGYA